MKVRITNFNADNCRTFILKCFTSFDHFLPFQNSLAVCNSGFGEAEFSSHCKVSRSSSTKEVPPWLNFPVSHDLIFAPVEDIETGIMLVKWSGQLMTTGQLSSSDLKLKFFAV